MKDRANNLVVYSIALFAFFLPVNEKLSTLSIFICLGAAFFNWRNFNKDYIIKQVVFIIFLYFVYIFAYLKDGLGFGIYLFETKASLIIFPIIFALTKIDHEGMLIICKAFVFGCISSYLLCFLHPLIYSFDWSEFEFIPIKEKEFLLIKSENYNWINYFFSLDFVKTIPRAYFACYIVFSLALVIVFRKEFEKKTRLILLFLLLMALFQINSISGFISLSFVITFFVFYLKETKFKIVLFGSLVLCVFYFGSYSPRVKEYVVEIKLFLKNGNSLENSFLNERSAFWKNSIKVFKVSPIFGNGIRTSQKMLNKENQKMLGWSTKWIEMNNYNAHNQYLQFLMESGVSGFLVFLLSVFWFIKKTWKYKELKIIGILFMLIISIHMLSESIIYRYLGIAFFSCFYCLFLAKNNSTLNE